ncbi:MAG: MarR family transcriptional regulator [Pseudomonadota bacterium]
MTNPSIPPSQMLCFALYSTTHAMQAAYKPLLDPLGLTYPQYLALMTLMTQPSLTVSQLGAALHLDSNTLTPLLKRMEAKGWLTRRRDTGDDRRVNLALTDAGRALGTQAAAVPACFLDKTGFDPATAGDLREVLALLRANLRA